MNEYIETAATEILNYIKTEYNKNNLDIVTKNDIKKILKDNIQDTKNNDVQNIIITMREIITDLNDNLDDLEYIID